LSVPRQGVDRADSRPGRVQEAQVANFVVAAWLRGKSADSRYGEAARGTGLRRQVTLESFPPQASRQRQPFHAVAVLREESGNIQRCCVLLRSRKHRYVQRAEASAAPVIGQRHVVNAMRFVTRNRMRIIETELEFVPTAKRLNVVLGCRARLVAVPVTDDLARVVTIDDAGGCIGDGLLVSA